MKRILLTIIVALALAATLFAQPATHLDLVRAVKAQVLAMGIDLNHGPGECGRFEVTRRVIWLLRAEGAGGIKKFAGQNQCEGRAVDALMYPDGTGADILGLGDEGENTPHWIGLTVDKALWLPPTDPGDTAPVPTPVPVPTPPNPPFVDLSPVLARIDLSQQAIQSQINTLAVQLGTAEARLTVVTQADGEQTREQVRVVAHDFGEMFKDLGMFAVKYVLPVIAGIFAGRAMTP